MAEPKSAVAPPAVTILPLSTVEVLPHQKLFSVTYDQILPSFIAGPENAAIVDLFQREQIYELARYAPLYLYGPNGVGKTALSITLVNQHLAFLGTQRKAIYITAVDFARQVAGSIAADDMLHFRERFQTCEALFIDAIEGLAQMDYAQEELIHRMDDLEQRKALVVVSGSTLASTAAGICASLRSRLSGGLSTKVNYPSHDICLAIIKMLMQAEPNLARLITPATAMAILDRIGPSVSVASIRSYLRAYSQSSRSRSETVKPRDSDDAKELVDLAHVKSVVKAKRQQTSPNLSNIAKIVSKHTGVPLSQLRGDSRQSQIVRARSIAMYFCRETSQLPLMKVGEYFGGRDHTTVMHAVKKINRQLNEDLALVRMCDEIRRLLGSPH